MKKNLFLLAFLCAVQVAFGQNITFSCSYTGTTEVISGYAFENSDLEQGEYDVTGIVNAILKAFYVPENLVVVIKSPQVNNANAAFKDGTPYILYSKYFVESVRQKPNGDWRLKGIFAHEVAHHILFHTMQGGNSRRDLELQADKWAGSALYKLGATLEQATACVQETNENGSSTHPPRADRLYAVKAGWLEAKNNEPRPPRTSDPFADLMKPIPSGSFSREGNSVTLSSFYMSKYEVTQKQWRDIMGSNPSHFSGCDNCPVEQVSWNDIQNFLQKLNTKTGKNYRLPTEAEWEYACRAGTTTPFNTGENLSRAQANYDGNDPWKNHPEYRPKTMPVGSFAPNTWGLYDMHGNVWEWCNDWYGAYSSGAVTNPKGSSTGTDRVLRGGSWINDADDCRSAFRDYDTPDDRGLTFGFRLAL